jgi:hypothetical protein
MGGKLARHLRSSGAWLPRGQQPPEFQRRIQESQTPIVSPCPPYGTYQLLTSHCANALAFRLGYASRASLLRCKPSMRARRTMPVDTSLPLEVGSGSERATYPIDSEYRKLDKPATPLLTRAITHSRLTSAFPIAPRILTRRCNHWRNTLCAAFSGPLDQRG